MLLALPGFLVGLEESKWRFCRSELGRTNQNVRRRTKPTRDRPLGPYGWFLYHRDDDHRKAGEPVDPSTMCVVADWRNSE